MPTIYNIVPDDLSAVTVVRRQSLSSKIFCLKRFEDGLELHGYLIGKLETDQLWISYRLRIKVLMCAAQGGQFLSWTS